MDVDIRSDNDLAFDLTCDLPDTKNTNYWGAPNTYASIDSIIQDYSLQTIENLNLPSVWAYAFLASLAVTIGHLSYQAFAPSLIRRMTMREYVQDELRQFVESPSDGRLESARYYVQQTSFPEDDSQSLDFIGTSQDIKRKELTLIENGSRNEYLQAAEVNVPAALASAIFYSAGLI